VIAPPSGDSIGRISAEIQQRKVQLFRISVEVPQIRGDLGADRDVRTQRPVKRARDRCEATACDKPVDRLGARSRSVEELPAEQRASRDRLLHFADDGLSVRGIALALEQPQATSDHGEKVVGELSTSTTTSSSGGLSTEPGNETPIVSLICMSDLLACDRSTERRLQPVHEGRRRWIED
jgi:hypothetical protein